MEVAWARQSPRIGRSVYFNVEAGGGKIKPQHAVIIDVIDPERDVVRLLVTNWYGSTTTKDRVQRGDEPGAWNFLVAC